MLMKYRFFSIGDEIKNPNALHWDLGGGLIWQCWKISFENICTVS
ncbi:hypothetical protein BLA17378_08642 [Burkholderia aenigmatica]|uniref:Uncharacterized protein n=1 Tax=Burkholderia aenigmatica TaxID=2015348 RepID=A0ABY6YA41_9BURK|nr:hypothetical protein BLA17378_08642 [Burkholderia aenigmatica]